MLTNKCSRLIAAELDVILTTHTAKKDKKTARHGKVAEAEADGFFSMAKRQLNTAK